MVDVNSTALAGNLINVVFDSLKNMSGATTLIKIGQAVGIVILVYLVFLIIRAITNILYSLRFKKVAKNIESINNKMDLLIDAVNGKSSKAKKK